MPAPFNPALRVAASRGWRVLRGGATAAERRAAALERRSAQPGAAAVLREPGGEAALVDSERLRAFDLIDAQTGESRRVVRRPAPRYSPEATREQAARAEALRRHAEARGGATEDPREWGAGERPDVREHFERLSEQEVTPREPSRIHFKDSMLLDRFEEVYGWRPPSPDAAKAMLSPQALDDLMNPKVPGE